MFNVSSLIFSYFLSSFTFSHFSFLRSSNILLITFWWCMVEFLCRPTLWFQEKSKLLRTRQLITSGKHTKETTCTCTCLYSTKSDGVYLCLSCVTHDLWLVWQKNLQLMTFDFWLTHDLCDLGSHLWLYCDLITLCTVLFSKVCWTSKILYDLWLTNHDFWLVTHDLCDLGSHLWPYSWLHNSLCNSFL